MGSSGPSQVDALNEDQLQGLQQLFQGLSGAIPGGFEALLQQLDPEKSAELFQTGVADPALKRFQSDVIPSILQSSANLGSKGGSSIDRQLARSGSQLEEGLAAQLAQFQAGQQQSGLGNLSQLLGIGLGTQPFAIQPGRPGVGRTIAGPLIGAAAKAGSSFI